MLGAAVSFANAVCQTSKFDPLKPFGLCSNSSVFDIKVCREKVMLFRKSSEDTLEHWVGVDSVSSAVVNEIAPRTHVPISNVV